MKDRARASVRPRRWLTAFIGALIAAGGVQLALVSMAGANISLTSSSASLSHAVQRATASVMVQIRGLPPRVRANVTLTGPGRRSHRISTTTRFAGLVAGTYFISAQPVVSNARTYHPTVEQCSPSGRCSTPSHGRISVKAHQRVSVAVAYSSSRSAPPNSISPIASQPTPGSPQITPPGTLAPGASETGGWSASIHVPAGGPQAQVDAVVSFPIALNEVMNRSHTVYLTERQVQEPGSVPGCNGSANVPIAEPGYLCVYQGATATQGSLESEWKNAGFFALEDFAGNIRGGKLGALVVFRTTTFTEPPSTIPAAAALTAAGSWAVTEKR